MTGLCSTPLRKEIENETSTGEERIFEAIGCFSGNPGWANLKSERGQRDLS
jgi:hypothetical protein